MPHTWKRPTSDKPQKTIYQRLVDTQVLIIYHAFQNVCSRHAGQVLIVILVYLSILVCNDSVITACSLFQNLYIGTCKVPEQWVSEWVSEVEWAKKERKKERKRGRERSSTALPIVLRATRCSVYVNNRSIAPVNDLRTLTLLR